MKKFDILKILCENNPDWNGVWLRSEVKETMKELGITSDFGEWPYVFDHVFSWPISEINMETIAELFEAGTVTNITFTVNGQTVRIIQYNQY